MDLSTSRISARLTKKSSKAILYAGDVACICTAEQGQRTDSFDSSLLGQELNVQSQRKGNVRTDVHLCQRASLLLMRAAVYAPWTASGLLPSTGAMADII